jgi:hypothetical protein
MVPSTVPTDRLRAHRRDQLSAGIRRWPGELLGVLSRLSPEWRDALVYGASALFAGVTGLVVGIPLYRQWGQLAVFPYVAAAGLMAVVAWRVAPAVRSTTDGGGQGDGPAPTSPEVGPARPGRRPGRSLRVVALLLVLLGATVVPLALEVIWASEGNPSAHVQPEVLVVERAGVRAAHGDDPYRVVDRNGHILIHQTAEPVYELYYPYLPGMVIFGFSSGTSVSGSSVTHHRLTDARIQFLVFTILVTLLALSRLRPRTDARFRAFQVLTVLPTAALPLATGGDDMPVVALMLLGLVALQRRRPVLAGLALGAASSLKFTAWPLVVLALWAVRDLHRRRALGRYLIGVAAVVVPVVVPVALRNPSAFVDNVIRFPLGLAGVSSPAASALPGHVLVSAFPGAHRAYVVVVGILGVAALAVYLRRRPPGDPAQVASLTGWVMLIAILLAPATRVGYVLYPINLFVWAWMLRRSDDPALPGPVGEGAGIHGPPRRRWNPTDQLSSGSSNSSTVYGVVPVDVVGDTTAPTSQ